MRAVPTALAVKVPSGNSLSNGFRLMERRYRVKVPGKENKSAAVA